MTKFENPEYAKLIQRLLWENSEVLVSIADNGAGLNQSHKATGLVCITQDIDDRDDNNEGWSKQFRPVPEGTGYILQYVLLDDNKIHFENEEGTMVVIDVSNTGKVTRVITVPFTESYKTNNLDLGEADILYQDDGIHTPIADHPGEYDTIRMSAEELVRQVFDNLPTAQVLPPHKPLHVLFKTLIDSLDRTANEMGTGVRGGGRF